MYQDRIDYIKEKLKETYKRYTGEITDQKASIKNVADYFNIPVDESRLEDYIINRIDFNTPSIKLSDKKNKTTYISEYTYDANLLNYSGVQKKFNSLLSLTPTHKTESLYYIGDKNPIIENMTFNDGEFDLVFERKFGNKIEASDKNSIQFTIRYSQQLKYEDRNVKQQLLTKIYKIYSDKKNKDSLEQLYTYDINNYVEYNYKKDKYTYVKNNGIIYGINELEINDKKFFLSGICFENTNSNLNKYFPLNMNPDRYQLIKEKKNTSAMIFTGFSENSYYSIEIYKNDITLHIKYYEENHCSKSLNNDNTENKEIDFPLLNTGNISNEEIQIIINELNSQFSNNEFINLISNELVTFGKKIDIRKGIIEEESDILNPKLFIEKPFDDIAKLINKNKKEFFDLISEQFENATSIDQSNKKGETKILKPNESKK